MITVRKTFVDYKPPISEDYIWIDVSGAEPIQKIFLNGEWKPLKDSDVDAKFSTGEKVSSIGIEKTSATVSSNSKIPTLGKVTSLLNSKADISTDETIRPELVEENVTATIDISEHINSNLTIDVFEERNVDIIDLKRPVIDSDYVTTIRFISSATPTAIKYDDIELKWANEELPICEENAEYLIAIWKNIGIMTKVAPIPLS